MATAATNIGAQFVINVGDSFYDNGVASTTDPLWNSVFENMYLQTSLLNIPWYSVLGNHDYNGNPTAQIQYYQQKLGYKRWYMPDHNYTMLYTIPNSGGRHIEFVFIDAPRIAPLETSSTQISNTALMNSMAAQQVAWLDKTLSKSTATWVAVVGHYQGSESTTLCLILNRCNEDIRCV